MSLVEEYKKRDCKKTEVKRKVTAMRTQSSIEKMSKKSMHKIISGITSGTSLFEKSFGTPGTSFAIGDSSATSNSKKETPYAIYHVKRWKKDGSRQFSKSLLRYFMKVDSPAANDLKMKRFNTSFWHERPRNRDKLQIFSPDEDNDPKWFVNVPQIDSNLPEIPGTQYADIFKSMPIDCYSDDEQDILAKNHLVRKNASRRIKIKSKRKIIRCTGFKGKPLPDEALLFNYSDCDTNGFESKSDDDSNIKGKKRSLIKSSGEKNNVKSTSSSVPSRKPVKLPKYACVQTSNNLPHQEKDEKIIDKYKSIVGKSGAKIFQQREPKSSQIIELNGRKNSNVIKSNYNLRSRKIEQE